MSNAPICKACKRPTWNPSGYCHDHIGFSVKSNSEQNKGPTETPHSNFGKAPADAKSIASSFTKVFDEIDIATPFVMNEMAEQTVKGLVSIESMRRFPESDVRDEAERAKILRKIENEVIQDIALYPSSSYSDDMIVGFRNSSEDRYGIGKDEAMLVTTFALRKEWEMGRALGESENTHGVPYDSTLKNYMIHHRMHLQNVARVEFRRNLAFYPEIIHSATGRAPLNTGDVLNENMRRQLLDDSVPHENKLSESERLRYSEPEELMVKSKDRGASEILGGLAAVAGLLGGAAVSGVAKNAKSEVRAMANFNRSANQFMEDQAEKKQEKLDNQYKRAVVNGERRRKRTWF